MIAGIPIADHTQDYELVFGLRNNTHVVFEFKRLIDTCDPDDLVITVSLFDLYFIKIIHCFNNKHI